MIIDMLDNYSIQSSYLLLLKNKFQWIVVTLLFCTTSAFGQVEVNTADSDRNTWQTFTYDVGNMFGGVGYSYTRPLYWKGQQWKTFGAITAGTGLLFLVDEQTSAFMVRQKPGIPTFIRGYGSRVGSPEYNYMLTGVIYLTGLALKDPKLRRTGVLLVASATSAGLLQQVAKSAIGRARPGAELGKATFDPFNPSRNFHSFPSGHTILAFTNAYAIAKQFENPWLKGGIYVVGIVPGISRMWDSQHWLTDVFFSVAISVATVEAIDRYLDRKYDQKYLQKDKRLSIDLNLGPGQIGITAQF